MMGNAFSVGGSDASLIEIIELITKHTSELAIEKYILENLKPPSLIGEDSATDFIDIDNEYLDFAILKITAKCAKFGFDQKYFIETID